MKKSLVIIFFIIANFFAINPVSAASAIIEGNISNAPVHKIYLTNRGFATNASFILKIYDSCTIGENGSFYFIIKNLDESRTYSIEFTEIKFDWIPLLPRKNEHIRIKAAYTKYIDIESITGSMEYALERKLDSVQNPLIRKLNSYSDSSSMYWETKPDSAKYFTRLNKICSDSLLGTSIRFVYEHPYSVYGLWLIRNNTFHLDKGTIKQMLLKTDKRLHQLSLYKYLSNYANTPQNLSIGDYPPPLYIIDTAGRQKEFDFHKYAGKILVLDFWASWCGPCREKIPDLKLLYDSLNLNKYAFVSVSIDEDKNRWNKALDEEQMPWENVMINNKMKAKIFGSYSLDSVPQYIMINSEGKVFLIAFFFDQVQEKIDLLMKDKMLSE